MSIINQDDPLNMQVAKQARIIDALMRRANREQHVGPSAYRAFHSAIELQAQVAAQSRDLERANSELESVRYERERSRKNLAEALSSMKEGIALFSEGQLDICNDLFRSLLPDVSERLEPGLQLLHYFDLMSTSAYLVSTDQNLSLVQMQLQEGAPEAALTSLVVELAQDRWYQMSLQRTSPGNIVLLLTEITAIVRRNRIEKEHLIDRQADYLQAVFQNMTSAVCTFSAKGEVMMQNGRFREILGVPNSALLPGTSLRNLLDFMRSHNLVSEKTILQIDLWRRELTEKGRLRERVRHGADRVLDLQANALPDGGFLVELKDVTLETRTTEMLENRVMERTAELTRANARLTEEHEVKARVQEELRIAKERAEAAVSSKTRFLAAASHDLLQPINAAKLMVSTLRETTRETEFQPMIERLDGAFMSAEALLHSLLDISRLESADPDAVTATEVNLWALMEGVHADQTMVAEQKNVQLDVVCSSLFVWSDPVYLLRSIQNLVVNAIQYTLPGGRVLVGCRRRGSKVVLEVWDTGIGIARKDQDRVFEEFARAETGEPTSGVGLGLSVVERTCRHLDHTCSVRSKPGEGSVFSIEMDIVEGRVSSSEPRGLIYTPQAKQLDCIAMVIENDEDVLFGMVSWLEQMGASVLAATSTREALAHVTDIGMPPDIILADFQLDNGDTGIDAITEIRTASGTQVPAILITADRSELLRSAGIRNDFLVMTKPVKLSRLRPLIDWKLQWSASMQDAINPPDFEVPTKVGNDSYA